MRRRRKRRKTKRRKRKSGKGKIITNRVATRLGEGASRPLRCVMSLSEVAGKGTLYEQ